MALILNADAGSSLANSYATVAEADAYHEGHLYAADWDAAEDKERALVTATRLLDENAAWVGSVVSGSQALGWPRSGAYSRGGYLLSSGVIPTALKNATAELARLLVTAKQMPNSDDPPPPGLRGLSVGSISLEFDPTLTGQARPTIPQSVWAMIGFLMESPLQNRTSVPLYRV